ncbi:putative DNA double-strand break repair Rad50 ATPase-like [Patagioenas fasciata monilis]|uniref:Putative DNA double-strand break repair Rad50 ATPase-like n=1 Tax=Patagioenas fasciata monilis TaxID=372326 RepID=A0A1V4KCU5_PATFA|nr:putative DNA double-strand break repair Rad50 ATPase-like [Patagioenas fasciata monilis]
MYINKWSFLNSLVGWSENRALGKDDHLNKSGVCSDTDHEATDLEECTTKEVPYISYKFATLYIIKIVNDMQQMKNKHVKIIRQLDKIRKENQEQTITAIMKHYGEKMRSLKSQLEAYRELMNKSSTRWQDTVKNLRKRNRQLIQEKEDLLHQMKKQTEKWEEEKVSNEEGEPEWSMEKGYLWQAHTMLEKIQESIQKREREVTELLQSERRYNRAMKPQITVLIFLKTLVNKVHTIYCDVPEAQQYISQLIRKNKDQRADWKEAFNNAQTDILSYEVFYGNEPMDDERTQFSMELFRTFGKAKSELEYVEIEKIVFDCIQRGEIPNCIKRSCLYAASRVYQRTKEQQERYQYWNKVPISERDMVEKV